MTHTVGLINAKIFNIIIWSIKQDYFRVLKNWRVARDQKLEINEEKLKQACLSIEGGSSANMRN